MPSYHVQQLFSCHQGTRYVCTLVDGAPRTDTTAASATCQTDACERVALKVGPLLCTLPALLPP